MNYIIRYKYEPTIVKVGTVHFHYRINATVCNAKPAIKSLFAFKSKSIFDSIRMMSDTLTVYTTFPDLTPLYLHQSVKGNNQYIENTHIKKYRDKWTAMQAQQTKAGEVYFNTIISTSYRGYDLLNILFYIRNMNYSHWITKNTYHLVLFIGDQISNIIICYIEFVTFKMNDLQHNASHLSVDMDNKAIVKLKNSMKVWINTNKQYLILKMNAYSISKIGVIETKLM